MDAWSQAIYSTCRSLLAEGAEILIATTNADGESVLPVVLEQKIPYQGVATIFFHRQFSEALKYSRPLAGWLNENVGEFDLVHIHAGLYSLYCGERLPKRQDSLHYYYYYVFIYFVL